MMQYVNQHPYVINYKANMMVDYFMQHSAQKMKGQAKAIVVTSSRANAILFHQSHHTPVEREIQWRDKSTCGIQW